MYGKVKKIEKDQDLNCKMKAHWLLRDHKFLLCFEFSTLVLNFVSLNLTRI